MPEKMWGGEPFWGLSYDWDPDWVLTDRQKELRRPSSTCASRSCARTPSARTTSCSTRAATSS